MQFGFLGNISWQEHTYRVARPVVGTGQNTQALVVPQPATGACSLTIFFPLSTFPARPSQWIDHPDKPPRQHRFFCFLAVARCDGRSGMFFNNRQGASNAQTVDERSYVARRLSSSVHRSGATGSSAPISPDSRGRHVLDRLSSGGG